MIGIINASPLIYLGKIGAIELLPQIFSEIWTTEFVKQEVLRDADASEKIILQSAFSSWLQEYKTQDTNLLLKLQELQIHKGEASIIALAKELTNKKKEKTIVVIDDLAARKIARSLGLNIIGTIGILLRSVKNKLISTQKCKTLLRILNEKTTFRMTIKVYSIILAKLEDIEKKTSKYIN